MAKIEKLLEIMARLRDPEGGCPWDLEQRFESIAPYTIEEAYEVDDAIRRGDMEGLRDELGDLLLQVVFHAQIADEARLFGFEGVVDAICEKMIRRHPHVFGDAVVKTSAEQTRAWEETKAQERRAKGKGAGALDGVPLTLPALLRAEKLQRRASRAGVATPDEAAAAGAIASRLVEIGAGLETEEKGAVVGELLFSVVALARALEVEPEECLRAANARFERLFRESNEKEPG